LNGPFELIPVVIEFFEVSGLLPDTINVLSAWDRAPAARSSTASSAPTTRKRSEILDVLDNFLDSQFTLIGDTGEQDRELYAVIAKERPQQILGALVRDVGAWEDGGKGIDDLRELG